MRFIVCAFLFAVLPLSSFAVCNDSWDLPQGYGKGPTVTDALQKAAHDFMKKNKLIRPTEEDNNNGVITEWRILKIISVLGKNLIVMNLQIKAFGTVSNGDSNEVLVLEDKPGKSPSIRSFEEEFAIPSDLCLAIGSIDPDLDPKTGAPISGPPQDLYYVRFTGASVVAALKSIYTGLAYYGFSGNLTEAGGKEPFDPTPNRKWKIINPFFDLRRGTSAEIHDVRPAQLDQDYQAYFIASAGHVAPWVFAFIRKALAKGNWIDINLNLRPQE